MSASLAEHCTRIVYVLQTFSPSKNPDQPTNHKDTSSTETDTEKKTRNKEIHFVGFIYFNVIMDFGTKPEEPTKRTNKHQNFVSFLYGGSA